MGPLRVGQLIDRQDAARETESEDSVRIFLGHFIRIVMSIRRFNGSVSEFDGGGNILDLVSQHHRAQGFNVGKNCNVSGQGLVLSPSAKIGNTASHRPKGIRDAT